MRNKLLTSLVALACICACAGETCAKRQSASTASTASSTSASYTPTGSSDNATNPAGVIYPQDSAESAATSDAAADSRPTSQTERVNNLANLEALLNIICNLGEMVGLFIGAALVVAGTAGAIIGGKQRWIGFLIIGVGVVTFVGGLALPGIINWLVASARDAGLFS